MSGIILFGYVVSRANTVVYNGVLVHDYGQTFIVPVNIRERLNSFLFGATLRRIGERWRYSVTNHFFYRNNYPAINAKNILEYTLNLQAALTDIFRSGTDFAFYGTFRTARQNMNEKKKPSAYYHFDFSRNFGAVLDSG